MKFTLYLFGRRSVAYLIDAIVASFLIRPHAYIGVFTPISGFFVPFILDILSVALILTYFVGCHAKWGRTLGKAAVQLRVATKEGISPLPFRHSLVRYAPFLVIAFLAFIFDWFVYPYSNFGYVWIEEDAWPAMQLLGMVWILAEICICLKSRGHRSIHDLIAGTVVTYEHAKTNTSANNSVERNAV